MTIVDGRCLSLRELWKDFYAPFRKMYDECNLHFFLMKNMLIQINSKQEPCPDGLIEVYFRYASVGGSRRGCAKNKRTKNIIIVKDWKWMKVDREVAEVYQ